MASVGREKEIAIAGLDYGLLVLVQTTHSTGSSDFGENKNFKIPNAQKCNIFLLRNTISKRKKIEYNYRCENFHF